MSSEDDSFDCSMAWEQSSPFLHVKNALYTHALKNGEFHVEYPHDELFNMLTTKALVEDAMMTDRSITIHYKWEPLDDNIVIYSASGNIIYTDVAMRDSLGGFIMQSSDDGKLMAFAYNEVFWLEKADTNSAPS
jgi:hypothetical protein